MQRAWPGGWARFFVIHAGGHAMERAVRAAARVGTAGPAVRNRRPRNAQRTTGRPRLAIPPNQRDATRASHCAGRDPMCTADHGKKKPCR